MDLRVRKWSFEFRWAQVEEWKPAMELVWRTFMKYEGKEYTQEGIQHFFDFITDDDLYRLFLNGEYRLMVALDQGRIIGVGSVRSRNHLSLLFVDEAYHRRGVGSTLLGKLCEYLKAETGESFMSVQAAPYAVEFYRKQGFHALCHELHYAGIRVTPMEKEF
jgi:GNAT superfamily N-acetyltransferase